VSGRPHGIGPPDEAEFGWSLPEPIDWEEFWAGDEGEAGEWLVEPLLPARRQVVVYSPAKVGKSLLALELSAALATGRPVLDRPAGPPLPVVYIDMEMTEDDLRERLEDLGYGPADNLKALRYYQLCDLPPLDTEAGGSVLARIVDDCDAWLVVLDTMARVVSGQENLSDTYRDFYRFTGRRLKAAEVALLRLDNTGHDNIHQRGSAAKADDVDVVWRLSADGTRVALKCTHRRPGWIPEQVNLDRCSEPLRHLVHEGESWPDGTADCAADLDSLGVPLDATFRSAKAALKAAGQGRRAAIVTAALKWRRRRP
jgi:hypothetical protein